MRGGAPMIVALLSGAVFGEVLTPLGWLGIALISGGIFSMAALGRGQRAGLWLALANTCVIATYTINDGLGARASGAPIGYTLWVCLLTAPPVMLVALWLRGRAILPSLVANWPLWLLGGAGTLGSYGVALWAMTLAPVALVAALRETSILFAVAISGLFLGEVVTVRRLLAVLVIGLGAAVLRLS
jgi:drug/metabolite transporter (DMT)-like permease